MRPLAHPVAIYNPNGALMYATHEAELDIPLLPAAARRVYIIPDLSTAPLIAVAPLCDAGCIVTFTKTSATVHLGPKLLLTGSRDPNNGLWHLDMPDPNHANPSPLLEQTESAAATIDHRTSPANLVAFAHASLFSPALSTLHDALRLGYITGVPGLTAETLRRHPPSSIATTKGHLDQIRKNLRSTKPNAPPQTTDDTDDYLPTADPPHDRTHHCFAATFEPTGKIYSDLTGKFIAPSSTGNNYILVVYDFDSNAILTVPMKNRSQQSHTDAFRLAHQRLVRAGLRPRLQLLDNECSTMLKTFMHDQDLDFQLVPPYLHRRNAAERAIRTFKNHFIAGLCSTDPAFPIHLWDRLLPQAELTLNLLRGSRLNPKLSAWAQLHGTYDYNCTPLAPPGCKVLVHEKPAQRESWAPHATDGWYIGPALESYRCHTVWITETRRERITDTISFFPKSVALPLATPNDLIQASLQDIINILKKPTSLSTPSLSTSNRHALEQLAEIFSPNSPTPLRVATKAPPSPGPSPPGTPRQSNLQPVPASPLRVPTKDLPPLPNLPDLVPTSPRAAGPTDVTTAPSDATFPNLTGPAARNRQRRTPKKSAMTSRKPPTAPQQTISPHPNPHVTRQRTGALPQPSHLASHAATTSFEKLLLDAAVPVTYHMALHGNAFNPDTGKIAEYAELSQCSDGAYWKASNAEEIGRLAQGYKHIKGTNTIYFIRKDQVPRHKTATYLRIVCAHRPEKENAYRVRWTAGGNLIDYPHDASTKTADIITVKTLINSTLSTPGAKFMSGDLKDFYLGTPMAEYEYMRIHRRYIPNDIFEQYNLSALLDGDFVYVEIRRGMYGLPQAGRIANDYLRTFLEPAGYLPTEHTPGLWRHRTRPLAFSLVVDDFGVKYVNQDDVDHLLATLRQRYECKADWEGTRYCGLTLTWDYEARTCDISMPGYVDRALTRFTHPTPPRPEHSPHTWLKPEYGAKVHFAPADDSSPPLDAAGIKRIQEIVGVFLFYARAVDLTMLPALGTISTQQAKPTTNTLTAITKFLNYAASNPDACVRYRASGMHLHIESDASYLSEPKARSRYAGYHYLSEISDDPATPAAPNGAIHIPCQILKEVVSSAAEAELAGTFHNGKEACPIRVCLEELGHPQGPTPIITDNSTAVGIANDTVKQKRSKAMDMRFYWIRDRVRQGQFHIIWRKGALNRADYFTKHHPAAHHKAIRSSYLYDPNTSSTNYFQCLTNDEFPTTKATTAPPASSPDEGVCASLRHIIPSPMSMGEGVLIPNRNLDNAYRFTQVPICRRSNTHRHPHKLM